MQMLPKCLRLLLMPTLVSTTVGYARSAGVTGDDYVRYNVVNKVVNDDVEKDTYDDISNGISDAKWWTHFGDELLDSLIEVAVDRNYDLATAVRRIEIARQGVKGAQAAYYPGVSVNAGWTKSQMSGATTPAAGPASRNSYWNFGANASWEIDLFGKITASVNQSKAMYRYSKAEYAAAMLSVEAQLATAYVNLRVYQAEMDVAMSHSQSQLKVVNIAEARHKAGVASLLDVAQAKTVYYSTTASIPLLETSIRSTINTIAVLLGEQPSRLYDVLSVSRPLAEHIQLVSKTIPMDLINRRPDIVAARQSVVAAADGLGVARKDYLPSLTLNGSIGTSAHDIDKTFTHNSFTYSIAPTISWTLFDGFARRSASAEARLKLENEVDNYNQTVLNAVTEADNALAGYTHYLEYMSSIENVVLQSDEALRLSLDLYKRGLSAFTNVVDAQLNLLEYQNSLIVAKGDALVSLINLYKAIGGGWENDVE